MTSETVLACEEVGKDYHIFADGDGWRLVFHPAGAPPPVFPVLREVSLAIPRGRFVAVMGFNGAGKSTLLRVMGGLYRPSRGRVVHLGARSAAIYELGMSSRAMQSGRSYAREFLELLETPARRIPALLHEIHEFSELGGRFEMPLFTYSTGMRARLFFATATADPCDLYLIDEVLAVGDEHFRHKCWRLLRERRRQGAAGVFVTHDVEAVLKLCSEAYLLDQGRIVASGPAPEIARLYQKAPPMLRQARFLLPSGQVFHAEAGRKTRLIIPIETTLATPVECSYAVDRYTPEGGWELLLLGEYTPVASTPGRHQVILEWDPMPLGQGDYHLNLALVHHNADHALVSQDRRSWLIDGDPCLLRVSAPEPTGVLHIPWRWEEGRP